MTTTVGSLADAQKLARELVSRKLAACVQLEAITESHYRWQGEVCAEPEVRLVIKTLPGCEPSLQAFFAEQHPYDVPQFLACRMTASVDYARWVRGEVAAPESDVS